MTKVTMNELEVLNILADVAEKTAGDRAEGWWSADILIYAEYSGTPKQFAATCGSLVKKGLVFSLEYDRGQDVIGCTAKGLEVLDEAMDIERLKAADAALLASAY